MNTTTPSEWERICSQGRLIYWRRGLAEPGRYLAVSRDGTRWHWALHGPDRLPRDEGGGYRIHAEGYARTTTAAKRAADHHVKQQSKEDRAMRQADSRRGQEFRTLPADLPTGQPHECLICNSPVGSDGPVQELQLGPDDVVLVDQPCLDGMTDTEVEQLTAELLADPGWRED